MGVIPDNPPLAGKIGNPSVINTLALGFQLSLE